MVPEGGGRLCGPARPCGRGPGCGDRPAWARHLVTEFGAEEFIDLERQPFEEVAGRADLVLDLIGGDILRRSWAVVEPPGALVSAVEDPRTTRAARPGVRGVSFVVVPDRAELVELARRVDAGELRPIIGGVVPLADGRAAFEAKHAPGVPGKMVLAVTDQPPPAEAR
jgi:NADPH:quinone reductase-like Zn-dependent oxidoreductase